jgi:drug/metabolite transporter (DMT)-like permease
MPRPSRHSMGLILVVVADLLWSTVFVASQIGLRYINPYSLVLIRFLIAAALILAIAVPFGSRLGIGKELMKWWIWGLGFVYALGFLFQYMGQDMTSASDATLLTNLSPILIPFLAFLLLRERLTTFHLFAMGVSVIGLYFLAGFNPSAGLTSTLGYLLLLFTSISYALFTVLSKKQELATLGSSLAIIIAITVILAPFAIVFGGFGTASIALPTEVWALLIYLSIPCTLVAIILYLRGLAAISASEAAFLFLLQPAVGLTLSFTILGEVFSPYQLLGAVLIIIGLLVGMMANRRRSAKTSSRQQ